MDFTLFDDRWRNHLLPLTFTRPVSELRIGILTIREKWEKYLGTEISSWKTEEYLYVKYPFRATSEAIFLNGHCCPTPKLAQQIQTLKASQAIRSGERVIAIRPPAGSFSFPEENVIKWMEADEKPRFLKNLWEIFTQNETELEADFRLLTGGEKVFRFLHQ